ncbi:hypothetical protein NE865_05179 [Phthorimaea operculella]|nr:hypothetical protein NE865_05179 [Phthorimaea operculella]
MMMMKDEIMENGSGDANSSNVSPTKLMVNYIPELMTRDMMYALFSAMGKIESCKLIANRGYGFVEYEKHEDAEKARAAFNGLLMQGKTLKVSFALLNPENKVSHKPDTESNLYISNLPPDMTLERLNALFGPFGNITNSRVSQGIGFVCFETRPQAEEAIKHMNGSSPIPGAGAIVVKFANKPNQNKNPPRPTPRVGVGASPLAAYNGAAATTVYVYNIGEDTEELALWQLFGPYGAIDSIKVIKDPETKKNKGFAFVNMREYDEAAMAIQALNGYTLNGQVLSVSFKTQKRNN